MGRLTVAQQTIVAEFHILNDNVLHQLTMPMVTNNRGGETVRAYFNDIVIAMVKRLIEAQLCFEEYTDKWKFILSDSEEQKELLSYHKLYQMAYDTAYMLSCHLVKMNLPLALEKEDEYYNNATFFEPSEYHKRGA